MFLDFVVVANQIICYDFLQNFYIVILSNELYSVFFVTGTHENSVKTVLDNSGPQKLVQ